MQTNSKNLAALGAWLADPAEAVYGTEATQIARHFKEGHQGNPSPPTSLDARPGDPSPPSRDGMGEKIAARSGRRPGSHRGFTLIELLAVIAIIAVLAALLFPLASRMTAQGREAQCISRLKGLSTAFHLYAADNNGATPAWFAPGTTPFFNQLNPYLGLTTHSPYTNPDGSLSATKRKWNSVWYCPETSQDPNKTPAWILTTFGMSTCFSGVGYDPNNIRTLASFQKPSETAMFSCMKNSYVVFAQYAYIDKTGTTGVLSDKHGGGFNVIFLDGHCLHVTDLTKTTDPRNAWWKQPQ